MCRAGKWLLRHWQSPYSPVFVWGCFKWSSVSVTAMHLCGFALIHCPNCTTSCISTCLRAQGSIEEPENAGWYLSDFDWRGPTVLSLREIGVKYYLWDRMMVKGFSFGQTVIPTGCISDLVKAGLSCSFGFFGVASPSVYFLFADRTTVAFPVLGIIFCKGTDTSITESGCAPRLSSVFLETSTVYNCFSRESFDTKHATEWQNRVHLTICIYCYYCISKGFNR